MGDEHFTYYMTDEGETIVRDSLGYRLGADVRIETYGTEEAWQYRQKAD